MAKRTRSRASAEISTIRSKTAEAAEVISEKGSNLFEFVKDLSANPAVRYVAGGLAISALTKFVSNFSSRYPELTNMVKNSLDTLEGKLVEYKDGGSRRSDNLNVQH